MTASLLVLAGSALGGLARHWVGLWVAALVGPGLPWGTLGINVVGSFVIGLFAALTGPGGRLPGAEGVRALVIVGFCGGFTTFSSFGLQTLELFWRGDHGWAAAYVAASVALCLLGTWAGVALGQP